jgi:hypothetical protein
MQTLIRPQYLLRVRLIPSILTGSSLIPLRKLHSESRLQEQLKEKTDLPLQKRSVDKVFSNWSEFYSRARAIRNKSSRGEDLKEEPVDLFNNSHTTLNTIDEIFEKIDKTELYNFPKEREEDDYDNLDVACDALSHALQKDIIAKEEHYTPGIEHDTPEVKQALDNLRKAYDDAAKSNTVSMRYIDVEPPYSPLSPLKPVESLKQILLARLWVKELITEVRNQSLGPRILVVGKQGSGELFL